MKESIRYDGKIYEVIKMVTVETKRHEPESFALVQDEETGEYYTWFNWANEIKLEGPLSRQHAIKALCDYFLYWSR